MEEILRSLGYNQSIIENFRREGVTVEAVPALNMSQLDQLGIHGMGRQVILRGRCRSYDGASRASSSRSSSEFSGRHDASQRVRHLFSPYNNRRKATTLSVTFLCLASRSSLRVPNPYTQSVLLECGLGERKITLPSLANPEEVLDVLYRNFPKLKDGGGFEYLKAEGASKMFREIPLPPSGGFTAANLKTIAKNSRIYLRPIQRDLDMTVVESASAGHETMHECSSCKQPIAQTRLRQHIRTCGKGDGQSSASVEDDTEFEDDITLIDPFDAPDNRGSASSLETQSQPATTSQGNSPGAEGSVSSPSVPQPPQPQNEADGNSFYDRYISEYDNVVDPDDGNDSNDDILNAVIEESLLEAQVDG